MNRLFRVYLLVYVSKLNDNSTSISRNDKTTDRDWLASTLGLADASHGREPRNTIELLAKIDRMLEEPKVVSITAESAAQGEK